MNGQMADMLKIWDIVNRLKLINVVQNVEGLGVKLDSLERHRRYYLDFLLVKIFHHDDDNVIPPNGI